jgi:replicative DNA helicase
MLKMNPETDFLAFSDNLNLPYSIEAEQAVLGSIIIDPECLNLIASQMKIEYFYLAHHKEIYRTLTTMLEFGGKAIDFISLLEQLKPNTTYDEAGWKNYLTQLAKMVPTSANVMTYVAIIRERFYARSLLMAAEGIIKDVNENLLDTSNLLDRAEQSIYNIRQGRESSGLTHIKSVIEDET